MAAPKVEEKEEVKKDESEAKEKLIAIPEADGVLLEQLAKEMLELYKHKCKHTVMANGSVTFWPTPNCKPAQNKLATNKISMDSMLSKQNCGKAAAYSNPYDAIIQTQQRAPVCSFITAALTAWSQHYPFRFRAEHIWLLILQSVAVHVDKNAEKLRNKYVQHEGKKELVVDISGRPSPKEWMSTIANFARQIDENTVEDTCKLFDCDFSTSTLTEKIATKVTIMDICKNYFSYKCRTMCGFPQITLDGTKKDWIKLKEKTSKLLQEKVDKKFGAQWGEALLPILDRFIVAFDGNIDCVFWNSMIKRGARRGSGARSWYSGWFNIFFPFITGRWNRFCEPYAMDRAYVKHGLESTGNGPDTSDFPMGIASAPVKWDRNGTLIKLKFLSGFVGFKQDAKTLEICPNVSWCVAFCLTEQQMKEKESAVSKKRKRRYGR